MDENLAVMDEDEVHADRVAAILAAVEAADTQRLTALMEPLHAADIADLLEQIDPDERRDLLTLWSGEIDGDVLSELDETIREEVIASLPPEVVAEAVRDLDTDDVVDILEDLEAPAQDMILGALANAGGVAYLTERARDPKTASAFLTLVGKVLPLQVTGDGGGPVVIKAAAEDQAL